MAVKRVYVGSQGPQLYDTLKTIRSVPGVSQAALLGDDIQALESGGLSIRASDGAEAAKVIDGGIILANLVHGAMFQSAVSNTVALAVGVFSVIPAWTVSLLLGVTFTNTQEMTVGHDGAYKIDWAVSGELAAGGVNDLIMFAVFKNGVEQTKGSAQSFLSTPSDVKNAGSTAFFQMVATDILDLRVKNIDSSADFVVSEASFNMLRIGG